MSNQSDGPSTEELVARELARAVEPLITAVEGGEEGVRTFLTEAGFDEELVDGETGKVLSTLEAEFAEPAKLLRESVLTGEPSVSDVPALIGAVAGVFKGVQSLDDIRVPDSDVDALGRTLFDHLLVTYLKRDHHGVYGAFSLLGLVVEESGPGAGKLQLSKVGTVVESPNELPKEVFNWATDNSAFLGSILLSHLAEVLWAQGVPASLEEPPAPSRGSSSGGGQGRETQLRVPLVSYTEQGARVVAGFKLGILPAGNQTLPGIAVLAFGQVSGSVDVTLDDWTFNVEASADLADRGVSLRPKTDGPSEVQLLSSGQGTGRDKLHAEAGLSRTVSGSSGDGPKQPLLGPPDGTRLLLESVGAEAIVDYADGTVTGGAELPLSGRVVVSPEGGFLSTVMPDEVGVDFDTTVGWSVADGLYFEGGGTLEVTLPLHEGVGPLKVGELYGALTTTEADSDLSAVTAISPTLQLGPLTGTVKQMGISADLTFKQDQSGQMGPLDIDLGFHPPSGIGLSVDSGPVTGGGVLQFEPDKHRYAGGLELQFSSWGLTVVGLLKTEVPGTDGYSLLLLITADLPPVQLGFGFVMTGIGGLAGVHRGFKKKPLGKAVRSGNLDSVLFPEDVVANANQIITDLRAIFPPKADHHVFGPMLRLGWGTPVIVQAELGVLVSLPDWKVALLGKFMLDLPDEEVALIDINLAVVGVLDIPNKELAIDASLYDSRIVQWTVSGDMAMRLSWGADSRFMLSLGGFHPKYSPPKSFPELDRIKASMSPPGGNPRLEYTGYLAVTPNTFQVGAGVVLRGEFGPATVHGELSFDALFNFNPFAFTVDVFAKVSVDVKGKGLGLKLDGTLSGPQPYNVNGKLSIDILFFSTTVTVDATFGSKGGSKEMPTANVLPKLADALKQPANWSAQKPEDDDQLVTLRDPDAGNGDGERERAPERDTLLAHPLGRLAVRQQVVPLGTPIEKYGNAKPAHTRFTVSNLSVSGVAGNATGDTELREKFAPAKFERMSDSEKLESKAFQEMVAGKELKKGGVHYAGSANPSLLSWATLRYESSVIDQENKYYRTEESDIENASWEGRLDLATGHQLAEQSAVATAGTRTSGPAQYANPDQSLSVSVDEQRFVVAWRDDLSRLAVAGNPKEGQIRVEARDRLATYVENHDTSAEELQVVGVQELADGSGGGPS